MSFKRARKRDENERGIVQALRAIGASVTQLDGSGIPDLLVARAGAMWLLEVKMPTHKDGTAARREKDGGAGELTEAQVKWWSSWNGPAVAIVHSVEEALAAIGASRA